MLIVIVIALKAAYRAFLWSDEWRAIRQLKMDEQKFHCERCKYPDKGNDVHHIYYDGNNKLKDLMVLCSLCHSMWHKFWPVHAITTEQAQKRKVWFVKYKSIPKRMPFDGYITEKDLKAVEGKLKSILQLK